MKKLRPILIIVIMAIAACTPSTPIAEANYAKKIVGNWIGTVGDMKESITFRADGGFMAQVRPRGFFSNTLSQGTTGTIRGTWVITGTTITLTIISAEHERVKNNTTTSTILAFSTNELKMKSDRGEISNFMRTRPL